MAGAETVAHTQLKKLAVISAQQQGYTICGVEIRLPHSNYRADVVAYRPESKKLPIPGSARLVRQSTIGMTAVFECKQVRSDFLKDSHSEVITLKKLQVLEARRRKLEQLIGLHLPSLRKGESLFAEYDGIDTTNYEHKTYHRVLREIAILQRRLYGKTKFDKVTRYQCANLCYLVVEDGILESHEVPLGWGLLARRGDALVLERRPTWQDVSEPTRLALLQQVAVASTRKMNREFGAAFPEPQS